MIINTAPSRNIEKQEDTPLTRKQKLGVFFKTKRFHFFIIGIVFLDLTLLLIGLVLAIYRTPESLKANFILFLFSWIFPTIFIIELFLKMWVAGGCRRYFDTKLKKWDAFILAFSIVSDIMLYVLLIQHASATATAVVVFRLWKMVRLFHAYAHLVQVQNEEAKQHIVESNNLLQQENAQLKEENERLSSELESFFSRIRLAELP